MTAALHRNGRRSQSGLRGNRDPQGGHDDLLVLHRDNDAPRAAARRYVTAWAKDAGDAELLLDALGLGGND